MLTGNGAGRGDSLLGVRIRSLLPFPSKRMQEKVKQREPKELQEQGARNSSSLKCDNEQTFPSSLSWLDFKIKQRTELRRKLDKKPQISIKKKKTHKKVEELRGEHTQGHRVPRVGRSIVLAFAGLRTTSSATQIWLPECSEHQECFVPTGGLGLPLLASGDPLHYIRGPISYLQTTVRTGNPEVWANCLVKKPAFGGWGYVNLRDFIQIQHPKEPLVTQREGHD